MNKILASIAAIVLIAVLGVAVVFAYGSYKDLELKKEETKLAEKKELSKKQKNNDESQLQEQPKNDVDTEQQQKHIDTTNEGQNESEQANNNINNDSNNNETISENEVTPEPEKVQPTNNNEENTQLKYTAEDAKNMADDEFLDAYKEGMPSEDAEAVDELSKDPAYKEYLRGQVEARENGQGRNY